MKNRGSNPILTNLVGVHPRNIHKKFEANACSGLKEEVNNNNDRHRVTAIVQLLLSVTKIHNLNNLKKKISIASVIEN